MTLTGRFCCRGWELAAAEKLRYMRYPQYGQGLMYFALPQTSKILLTKRIQRICIYISVKLIQVWYHYSIIFYILNHISSCDFYIIRIAMDFFTSPAPHCPGFGRMVSSPIGSVGLRRRIRWIRWPGGSKTLQLKIGHNMPQSKRKIVPTTNFQGTCTF